MKHERQYEQETLVIAFPHLEWPTYMVVHPVMSFDGGLQECATKYPSTVCVCGYYRIDWYESQNHLIA